MNHHNRNTSCKSEPVTRHLFVRNADSIDIEQSIKGIRSLWGVDSVQFEKKHINLKVTLVYDALHLSIDNILSVMNDNGMAIAGGSLQKWKLGWYRFVDENIKDNAAREAWNCH